MGPVPSSHRQDPPLRHKDVVKTLSRRELTAALAVRQMLDERRRLGPVEAIRRLTPLQAQDPPAPFIDLAARLEGFGRESLEGAIEAGELVKTTIMRMTLHLAAASDYPAYHQLARGARLRTWRKEYAHLDEERVTAELGRWLRSPRTNAEIRERVAVRYDGVPATEYAPIMFARTLLPLVQLPPAGFWATRGKISFQVDERPLPSPDDAAELAVRRYLAAFGPASRRDLAAWAGTAQRDFAAALERVETVSHADEMGSELLDLPEAPLPPATLKLPVRFLGRWEQILLAYADRDRIIPPAVQPLKLTLSGDQTVTVDGRVAASWRLDRSRKGVVKVIVIPHLSIPRRAHAGIRAEGKRTALFCEPDAAKVEVAGI